MKKKTLIAQGVFSAAFGFSLFPYLCRCIAALGCVRGCADIPNWESAFFILASGILISGTFFLSIRLFRLAASRRNSK